MRLILETWRYVQLLSTHGFVLRNCVIIVHYNQEIVKGIRYFPVKKWWDYFFQN